MGVAYKKNWWHERVTCIRIYKDFKNRNIITHYNDPYIKKIHSRKFKYKLRSVNLKNINQYDVVFLVTDHDCYDYKKILKNSKLIIDTRNKYKEEISNKLYKL